MCNIIVFIFFGKYDFKTEYSASLEFSLTLPGSFYYEESHNLHMKTPPDIASLPSTRQWQSESALNPLFHLHIQGGIRLAIDIATILLFEPLYVHNLPRFQLR